MWRCCWLFWKVILEIKLWKLSFKFYCLSSFLSFISRKKALWFTNLFVILSAVLNIISKFINSYETIMVGRFFSGVLSGLFSGIAPMYLNELPPQNLKGAAGTLNQLTVVLGIVIVNILGLPQVRIYRKFLYFSRSHKYLPFYFLYSVF